MKALDLFLCCSGFCLLLHCDSAEAAAQDTARTIVRIRLSDSTGLRIADAELTIIRGLHDTVATGLSSAAGEWSVRVARSTSPYQLVARKIGFSRMQRFFMATGDSTVLPIRVGRIVQALASVIVSEKEDLKRKSYFIDSDDIAKSDRPLNDASDILIKLRQDMIYSRGGAKGPCESIRNIWINGIAVIKGQALPGQGPMGAPSVRMSKSGSRASSSGFYPVSEMAAQRAGVKGSPAAGIGGENLTVLEQIRPEHVEQMTYKDCWDTSIRGLYTQTALFIVLKAGIRYERGIGTYAIEGGRQAR
jgi:hypothetical protein